VIARLEKGASGEIPETPKPGDPALSRTQNVVVGSNVLAVNAAVAKARTLGFRAMVLSTFIEGETRDVAQMHAAIAKQARLYGQPARAPVCLISGGETTVTIRGNGKGGRNQEFALAAAIDIAGLEDVLVLSGGTDGTDGPTDAAGAMADGHTCERAAKWLLANVTPNVKVVPLSWKDGGPCYAPTVENVYPHKYPFSRYVYIYVNKPPGKPLEPKVKEFLKLVLSQEGQQVVAEEQVFIPLTPEVVREELKKLD
jgi:hypothetical protein